MLKSGATDMNKQFYNKQKYKNASNFATWNATRNAKSKSNNATWNAINAI
jgi:hypothetical protein